MTDADRAPSTPPLSHAGAFLRHGGFHLAACVEPDADRRHAFMRRWGVAQGFDGTGAAVRALVRYFRQAAMVLSIPPNTCPTETRPGLETRV